jgi:hypothetical protein
MPPALMFHGEQASGEPWHLFAQRLANLAAGCPAGELAQDAVHRRIGYQPYQQHKALRARWWQPCLERVPPRFVH